MRWTCLLVVSCLLLNAVPASAAEYSGHITVGNPASRSPVYAITTRFAPCDPSSELNGLDGNWYDLGESPGITARLVMDPTLDADVYFWRADCTFWPTFSCQRTGLGTPESCRVPVGARYATVEGFAGTGAFVLTIS